MAYRDVSGRYYERDVFDLPDNYDYERERSEVLRSRAVSIVNIRKMEQFFGEPKRTMSDKERNRVKEEYSMYIERGTHGLSMYIGRPETVLRVLQQKYEAAKQYNSLSRVIYDMNYHQKSI